MLFINDCYTRGVSLMLLCSITCCAAYNVDVQSAVVHHGPNKTSFGYRAEFLIFDNGSTRLLVSAPRFKPENQKLSGKHFFCEPLKHDTCVEKTTIPFGRKQEKASQDFGEKGEMFGLTVTLINKSSALVCGPVWNDQSWYSNDFPVGRCQLIPPGTSSLSPLYNNSAHQYIGLVEVDGKKIVNLLNGFAQFGFSAAVDGDGDIVIGTPGFSLGKGSFGVLTLEGEEFDMNRNKSFDDEAYVNLGFAVTVGNFCGNVTVCFAVSNRMPNGKVYIVARKQPKVFDQIQLLQEFQDYSSYGSSLCSMDINGDGLSDLLVGAPTYSYHNNVSWSYDEGRVFVYLQLQGKLQREVILAGGSRMFARFGSAIGDIGDINQDSINDVAVGAPQEDEGVGAVYIYLGGSKGPSQSYSQRISGQLLKKGLLSFGTHISQPISNLSAYPAFAVGSPESDAVVVLRIRPIINARAYILTPASPVNSSNNLCPPNISIDRLTISGCLELKLCVNYSVSHARQQHDTVSFDLTFEIDTQTNRGWRRMHLYRGQGNPTVKSVRETVSVNSEQGHCQLYTAVMREKRINLNRFQPVKIEATFALNTTQVNEDNEDITPILNKDLPTNTLTELRFLLSCGENQTCRPDLVLSGNVLHVPSEEILNLNVVNITSEVVLNLSVTNKQETAYGIRLIVSIQGQIQFRAADGNYASSFSCDLPNNQEDNELDEGRTTLTCSSWSPLNQGNTLSVRLLFDGASVSLEASSPLIMFNVTSEPYDIVQNPEIEMSDNTILLESRKVIIADLHLEGSSDPHSLYIYPESDHTSLQGAHRLLVTNRGPSFMPSTHVIISLPYMDMEGRELLISHNVMVKHSDGAVDQCSFVDFFDAGMVMTTQSTVNPSTTLGSEGLTFGEVKASRRRRRQAGDEAHDNTTTKSGNGRQEAYLLDCMSYKCKAFKCRLPILQRHSQVEIDISLVLDKDALIFSSNIDTIMYLTKSKVEEPSSPFFYKWTEPRSTNVSTPIYYVRSRSKVSIWIIVGGVVGGLLVLVVIIVVLRRLGFFRRADKARLQRLKRESGFYSSRQQPQNSVSLFTEEESITDEKIEN
ncbi:integrin alpha-9-like isoform X1 [Pomacea canaliculata]|nr:integrin alpha-9-like isoform X1 [Pomacea canaliculata]